MRRINLRTVSLDNPFSSQEPSREFDYCQQIYTLASATSGGKPYSQDEVFLGAGIMSKAAAAKGKAYLDLEDAEWRFLRDKFASTEWAVAHPALAGFLEEVNNAKPAE